MKRIEQADQAVNTGKAAETSRTTVISADTEEEGEVKVWRGEREKFTAVRMVESSENGAKGNPEMTAETDFKVVEEL